VGGKSFKSKKKKRKKKEKKKLGGGRGENKVPKKKAKIKEKQNWEARVENKGAKKKLRSGLITAEKGQTKEVNLGWHRDRKENPISAPSIHVGGLVGVLVHSGHNDF
jgi:hypothetical protein